MKIVVVFFILLFGGFVVVGMDGYNKQLYAHEHYKAVDAVITRSEIKCGSSHGTCSPQIEYAYTFAGKPYQGSRYAFISRGESDRQRLARFPLNAKVTVYADPENPAVAVLNNEPWSAWQVIGMIFPFFIIVGIVLLLQSKLRRRRFSATPYPDRL